MMQRAVKELVCVSVSVSVCMLSCSVMSDSL